LTTSTWSPRFWHQGGDVIDLVLVARRVDGLTLVVFAVVAVDQHRHRDAVQAAAFGHLGFGGAGNLVIDDFLGLVALIARRGGSVRGRPARQGVADGHLALPVVGGGRRFLPGLARAQDPPFGIEFLRGLGHLVEVEIGRELHPGMAGPHHRGNDLLHLLAQAPLVGDLPLVGAVAATVLGSVGAVGEQAAGFVHDGHAFGLEAVDGGGRQMTDGVDLLRVQLAAHLEHDRSRRLRGLAGEQRALRQHQVDARRLHPVERPDGARDLALQRARMVDVLDEAGGPERVRLVEDFVADPAALGQAGFRQRHAQARHPVLRRQHDLPVIAQLVGDALALELLYDRGGILEAGVGEQRRHLRGSDVQDEEAEKGHQRDRDGAHGGDSRRTHRLEEIEQSLHGHPTWPHPTRQDLPGTWLPPG
jgi:hypothetical protein